MGSSGWVRSRVWIYVFALTRNTIALSGRSNYNLQMSRSFSTKDGSVESLAFSAGGAESKRFVASGEPWF
jgi:hypothetical protein